MKLSFTFINGDEYHIIQQIVNHRYNIGIPTNDKLFYLFMKCMNPDPRKRPTVTEILNAYIKKMEKE